MRHASLAFILIFLCVVVLIRACEGHWGWVRGDVEPARMAVLGWFGICPGLLIFSSQLSS
jgi:hypothetical protein